MRSRLKELVARRESEEGRRIHQREICTATGLNPNTISRWMSPEPFARLETRPLMLLVGWLGCKLDDLLVIEQRSSQN